MKVPKRCKNNGTGSDVMCSAMGMGVSTRILFTDEAAGSLSPSSKFNLKPQYSQVFITVRESLVNSPRAPLLQDVQTRVPPSTHHGAKYSEHLSKSIAVASEMQATVHV